MHHEPRSYRILPIGYGLLVMTVAMSLIGVYASWSRLDRPGFEVVWFVLLVVLWVNVLASPYEARLAPDGGLELRRLLGSRTLHARDVRSLDGYGNGLSFVLRHARGRIWFRVALDDTPHFVTRLRILNPAIESSGF